ATKPSLDQNTDHYYRGWDMAIADFWLFKEWEREFNAFVASGTLPNLELIALPHDHFGDVGPNGGAIDGVNGHDGLQRPMTDVFTTQLKPWSYRPIVPDVLRTTQLQLPPPTAANTLPHTKQVLAFAHAPQERRIGQQSWTGWISRSPTTWT